RDHGTCRSSRPPGRVAGGHGHRRRQRSGADTDPRRRGDPRCGQSRRAGGTRGAAMKEILAALRWRDALDIVLVAALVYRGLVLFRGTRSIQMVIGVALLMGGSVLARSLELRSITWILDNFWSFWAIALIVLFQPELRRALTRVGEGRLWLLWSGKRAAERAHVIEE